MYNKVFLLKDNKMKDLYEKCESFWEMVKVGTFRCLMQLKFAPLIQYLST